MATIDASSPQERRPSPTEPAEHNGPIDEQYRALTERCALLDRSERGKLALTGADAAEFLNGQITNDVATLRSGEGCYAALLTHKGKMLGDLRVLAVGPRSDAREQAPPTAVERAVETTEGAAAPVAELLLDTERVALQALFDTIRRFSIGYDVQLHKRTLQSALLSLIGPDSDALLARATADGARPPAATEHAHVTAAIDKAPVRLIRTDVGVDLLCDSAHAEAVAGALQAAGAHPVSEPAAEIVRVERGRPRYGVDLDDTTIPQEAGLNERAVSFTKGCYVGQETVARLYYKGKPNRQLRGLRLSEPVPAGAELLLDERPVGRLTSSLVSPAFGPIGLALVRREAETGVTLAVGDSGVSAIVTELPFQ